MITFRFKAFRLLYNDLILKPIFYKVKRVNIWPIREVDYKLKKEIDYKLKKKVNYKLGKEVDYRLEKGE